MIELDIEQGTREWIEARLGNPTASNYGRIVTPTGKRATGKGVERYIGELLAERVYAEPWSDFSNEWTDRGNALEPEAFEFYAMVRNIEPRKVGLVYRDQERETSCSPDALCDPDGGLELKCPSPPVHLLYLAANACPSDYVPQVQGCLWNTGRAWWDFMSYCPGLPEVLVRVEPDEKYQAALDKEVPLFIDRLLTRVEMLRKRGVQFELEAEAR